MAEAIFAGAAARNHPSIDCPVGTVPGWFRALFSAGDPICVS